MTDTELLIVGGGIHGTHLALRLVLEAGWAPERLTIIDSGPRLLAQWKARTRAVGMTFLRSPDVHHLGVAPFELRELRPRQRRGKTFLSPYSRPSLALFDRHAETLLERTGLSEQHVQARVLAARRFDGGVRAETTAGTLSARRVVLAPGRAARPLPHGFSGPSHRHVFDLGKEGLAFARGAHAYVVGGGLSAAQVALRLLDEGLVERVTIIARHPVRERMFDADPGWLGPKYLAAFDASSSWADRRAHVDAARHPGSMPPEVARTVRRRESAGLLRWAIHELLPRDLKGPVVFATGLDQHTPGESWIAQWADEEAMPRAPCGAPAPDKSLAWGDDRVFVMGPLAELVIGPVAPNIAGARRAASALLGRLPRERMSALRVARRGADPERGESAS